jgi:hypothetical protein
MASKKKPSIKVPLDDIVRNAMRALGKKNKKVGKAVKKADSAAEAKRYAEFKARRPSAAERAAKRSQFVPAETRRKGTQQMIREYDRGIKASQVNERLAKKDPNLLAFRESTGRPVTKKQIRDAKGADRGLKKNLPKKVKRETKKPEGQQISEAAKRADRKQAYKAKGGKNSPENIAKRQQKRAEMRKKNDKKK